MKHYFLAILAVICLSAASAPAEEMSHEGHAAHAGHEAHGGDQMCMPVVKTGSADEDFMRNMIPHHQMAVDMANELLAAGSKDPEVKKLAEDILKAQKAEIEQMQKWLAAREKK